MTLLRTLYILLFTALLMDASAAYALTAEQNTAARLIRTGMEQLKIGDHRGARDSFDQATRYNDSSSNAHLGLGIAYFHLQNDRDSERELNRAIELNPGEAAAYQFLGELSYRRDDLEKAVLYWEKTLVLDPKANSLRARIEKVRREHTTEKDFNRAITSHFLAKYEGREKIEAGRIVLRILEDAYSEIGRSLAFYPAEEIQVIMYSGQQFQDVTDAPGWSGGIFDGKIRIPIGGIEQETPGLRMVLYHEYSHAVVRSIARRCPTWLNEGLAQYFEGRQVDAHQREMLKKLVREGGIPPLANMEGSFLSLGAGPARFAYLISQSTVRYMIDTFGMYRVKMLLEELASGADTGRALNNSIMLSYEEFERGWKRSLE
jgi:tetratricopeptide (TPR) repeat protein